MGATGRATCREVLGLIPGPLLRRRTMTLASFTFLDSSWPYLVAALLAMVFGPLIYKLSARLPPLLAALDGFVLVSVGGLVFGVLLPDAVAVAGATALLATMLGMAVPTLVERFGGVSHGRVHAIGLVVALLGLFFHTVLDGAALAGGEDAHDHRGVLALAVVLHRLPVGMIVWWLVRPTYGLKKALASIAFIVFGTFCGVLLRATPIFEVGGEVFAWFQALVTGTLVHVVLHGTGIGTQKSARSTAFAEGAGGAVGFGVLLLVITHHHNSPLETFSRMFWDSVEAGFVVLVVGRILRLSIVRWSRERGGLLLENMLAVDALLLAYVFMGPTMSALLGLSLLVGSAWLFLQKKRSEVSASGASVDPVHLKHASAAAVDAKEELVWMFFALSLLAWVRSTGPMDFLVVHTAWRLVLPALGIAIGAVIPATLWVAIPVAMSLWVGLGSYEIVIGFLAMRVRQRVRMVPLSSSLTGGRLGLPSLGIMYLALQALVWIVDGGALASGGQSALLTYVSVEHDSHHSFEILNWCLCYLFVWLGWGPRGFIEPLVRVVERGLDFGREHSHEHMHSAQDEHHRSAHTHE